MALHLPTHIAFKDLMWFVSCLYSLKSSSMLPWGVCLEQEVDNFKDLLWFVCLCINFHAYIHLRV